MPLVKERKVVTDMKENGGFRLQKIIYAAVCLALCMVLPLLTGQVKELGNALCPMHIPVLLCGFLCGWPYALAVGVIAPLLRFLLFGMPPIFPIGVAMCFELAAYGFISGVLYRKLPKKPWNVYVALLSAMLGGRIVWGLVKLVMAILFGIEFTPAMFFAAAFVTAVPGIICHIVLIPIIVLAMERAGLIIRK